MLQLRSNPGYVLSRREQNRLDKLEEEILLCIKRVQELQVSDSSHHVPSKWLQNLLSFVFRGCKEAVLKYARNCFDRHNSCSRLCFSLSQPSSLSRCFSKSKFKSSASSKMLLMPPVLWICYFICWTASTSWFIRLAGALVTWRRANSLLTLSMPHWYSCRRWGFNRCTVDDRLTRCAMHYLVKYFVGVSAGLPRLYRPQLLPILLLCCNYEDYWH